jgi:hypothetical protein
VAPQPDGRPRAARTAVIDLGELVIAERVDGSTELRRPDPEVLAAWLDDYSLGDL